MNVLNDKVVFITGGTRGIGLAIAERFASESAQIAICGRSEASLRDAEAKIKTISPGVVAFRAAIDDSEAIQKGIDSIHQKLGPIDILINNAGIYRPASVLDTSVEDWDAQFRINLKGTFLVTQMVAKHMMERKQGRIVFLSSTIAQISPPGNSCYTATKWGLEGFVGCLAPELLEHNVMVNTIRPGFTDTSIFDEIGKPDWDIDWIAPEEIADAAVYICNLPEHAQVPELTYMTTFQRRTY